jgi:hypothetical protein
VDALPALCPVLRLNGVTPLDWVPITANVAEAAPERSRLTGLTQRLQLAVLHLRADLVRRNAALPVAPAAGYPWGWRPPGEYLDLTHARAVRVTPNTFPRGQALYDVLVRWLERLRWPADADPIATIGVSAVEMALDFEATTGVDVPRGFGGATHDIGARSRVLFACLQKLQVISPVPIVKGERLHNGRVLRPLVGAQARYAGFSRRPVFAGGDATEAAIRLTFANLNLRNVPGQAPGAVPNWRKRIPVHDVELRRRAAALF